MSLSIRQANIQDCPLILKFIRELADYEKLLHEVVADVAALESSLFGDKPHAEVVIAEHQGQPWALHYSFTTIPLFWVGLACIWKISIFSQRCAAEALAKHCWPIWLILHWSATAAGWSGGC